MESLYHPFLVLQSVHVPFGSMFAIDLSQPLQELASVQSLQYLIFESQLVHVFCKSSLKYPEKQSTHFTEEHDLQLFDVAEQSTHVPSSKRNPSAHLVQTEEVGPPDLSILHSTQLVWLLTLQF